MYSRISPASCGSLEGGSFRRSLGSSIVASNGLSVMCRVCLLSSRIRRGGRTVAPRICRSYVLFTTLDGEASHTAQPLGALAEPLDLGLGALGKLARPRHRRLDAVKC